MNVNATLERSSELLQPGPIREILNAPGPCVTVFLPPYRPGEPAGSTGALIKLDVRSAVDELVERRFPRPAAENLLRPLEKAEFAQGSHLGKVAFVSPDVSDHCFLIRPLGSRVIVGGCFSIVRLLRELRHPKIFYILALSNERVRLLRCSGLHIEQASLPAGVEETLAAALAFKPPDHTLVNRSTAGSSTGAMHGVRFGTGSGRETERTHLEDFYKLVDRGVKRVCGDAPLILAGVNEQTAVYRGLSACPGLMEGAIRGSLDRPNDLLEQAYGILDDDLCERDAAALLNSCERATPARVSTGLDTVLKAAFEGRVSELYINESAQTTGVFTGHGYRSWGSEDLLNLAAVQTLLHKGEACALPADKMANGSMVTAVLRY